MSRQVELYLRASHRSDRLTSPALSPILFHPAPSINSWHVMQYRTHGIASWRFGLISCPQLRQLPNVPSLIRFDAVSTRASRARSRDFWARSISRDREVFARSPSSLP